MILFCHICYLIPCDNLVTDVIHTYIMAMYCITCIQAMLV